MADSTPDSSHPEIVLVAVVGTDGVLGDGSDQPWYLPEDQRHFRRTTSGHPVVMGRTTYDTIGRPLPKRDNIVVTRNRDWHAPGVHVVHGVGEALELAAGLPGGDEIMVIGGGQIYAAVMDVATRLEMTEVDADAPGVGADATGLVRFPEIDPALWVETARDDRLALAFVTYRRR